MKFWLASKKNKAPRNQQRSSIIALVVMVGGFALFLQWKWLGQNNHLFAPFSIERIACEKCGKTGRVPREGANNVLEMCPACYGVGYHTLRRFEENEVLCPACLGLGRLEDRDGHWRTCRRCDGRGLIKSGAEAEEQDQPSTSNIQPRTSNSTR